MSGRAWLLVAAVVLIGGLVVLLLAGDDDGSGWAALGAVLRFLNMLGRLL